ncbi:MAG TPA: hypothetical protein DCG25_09525 [Acidimicrobiaceae bacterium]|nr:hypothetical protein [Acidimicrobiaceae bacterium]
MFAQLLLGERAAAILGILAIIECLLMQLQVWTAVSPSWMQIAFLALVTTVVVLMGIRRTLIERDRSQTLKERDVRQSNLLRATFDGTAVVQADRVVEVNEGLTNLLGYPEAELLGQPIEKLVAVVEGNRQSLSRKGDDFDRVELFTKAGETLRAERLMMHVEWGDEPAQLMAIRDISEQLKLQAQVQRSRRMESIGHLAATVAHEINNPLAVMQLRLDLLRTAEGATDSATHFDSLENHIRRISHIVGNLRSFASTSRRQREVASLSQLVNSAYRTSVDSVGSYSFDYSERPTDLQVHVLPDQIEQALVNIFLYAREYIPEPSGLEVRAYRERDTVKVVVRDTLGALDLTSVETIFSSRQLSEERLTGAALGISIAWGILQESGGFMYASTSPSGAAQIEFSLTCAQSEQSESPGFVESSVEIRKESGSIHVLLIEDESVLREAMTEFLCRENFQVSTAGSIREAMVHLETGRIDGIVSDYSLRDQTADGLLSHIENRFPKLSSQILLISGGFRGEQPEYPVMMKPFPLRDLKSRLEDWQPLSKGS